MRMQDVRAVTGGASGLGRAVAGEAIAAGGRYALLDVNRGSWSGRRGAGARATFFKVDVTSEQAVDAAIQAAVQAMDLSVAVNCAGVGWPRRMVGKDGVMPGEFFRKVVEINLVGTLLVC
jgi:NAD(P)-dependent dehydrogenase (short-subunit alcohol dehydrogenase family)